MSFRVVHPRLIVSVLQVAVMCCQAQQAPVDEVRFETAPQPAVVQGPVHGFAQSPMLSVAPQPNR